MLDIGLITFGKTVVRQRWKINTAIKADKLYYVFSGHAFCDQLRLSPGHLYLIKNSNRHKWTLGEDFGHIYFDFTISPELSLDGIVDLKVCEYCDIQALIQAYDSILTDKKYTAETENLGISMLYALLCLVDTKMPLFAKPSGRIAEIIRLITESDEMLSEEKMAQLACLDKHYFIKLFKKETGTTPYQFANNLRLTRAFAMLKNGNSISQVAIHSGFSSQAAFSNAFKRKFGVTPIRISKNKSSRM